MTDQIQEKFREIANLLREQVSRIESSVPVTQNHYGEYLAIFSQFSDDVGQRTILAKALVLAGANEQGVADALRLS